MATDALETRLHDLGEFIRDQRRNARLSLRKLSEAAGISNPYLSQIERGLRKPSAEILQAIAKGLRISAETLYVRAGILDERTDDAPDVVDAVLNDPTLNDRQKQVLVEIYRSFQTEQRAGRRPTAEPAPRRRLSRRSSRIQPSRWVPLRPDVRAPRRRVQHAHVAARPAGRGRRRRHERVRRTRSRPRSPAPVSSATSTPAPSTRTQPDDRRGRARLPRPARRRRAARARSPSTSCSISSTRSSTRRASGCSTSPPVDVLHANYWLSGAVAHQLKHELDLPLVATFHTLARVKADAGVDDDPGAARARRARRDRVRRPDARVDRRRTRRSSRRSTTPTPNASRSSRPASTTRCSHRATARGARARSASTARACSCSSGASSRSRAVGLAVRCPRRARRSRRHAR